MVFWEHKNIVSAIVPRLYGAATPPDEPIDVPTSWEGARFDVALRFHRPRPDAPWSFRQLSPLLLAGDSDAPVSKGTG